jgi:putative transcriptional regulator
VTRNHPNRGNPLGLHQPRAQDIKDARASAKLSQSEAADLVDATLRSWQGWEAGERRMPLGLWRLFQARLAYINGLNLGRLETLLGAEA